MLNIRSCFHLHTNTFITDINVLSRSWRPQVKQRFLNNAIWNLVESHVMCYVSWAAGRCLSNQLLLKPSVLLCRRVIRDAHWRRRQRSVLAQSCHHLSDKSFAFGIKWKIKAERSKSALPHLQKFSSVRNSSFRGKHGCKDIVRSAFFLNGGQN